MAEANTYPKGLQALLIGDHHWSHEDEGVMELADAWNMDVEFVSEGATDLFSVLDVAVNKPIKSFLKRKFEAYCAEDIQTQLQAGVPPAINKGFPPIADLCCTRSQTNLGSPHSVTAAGGLCPAASYRLPPTLCPSCLH